MTRRSPLRALTGDRRVLAAAFVTLFGMSAAHALLETARDALFLARLPAAQLPWAYLAIAAAAAAISRLPMPPGRSLLGRRALAALLVVSAAVTCAFWAVGAPERPWMLRGLYVWTGVNATLGGLQFWYVAGNLWTVTQAKRAYRWIVLGGLLGSVAGAAFARALAGAPDRLVLASAVVQALTGLAPALLLATSPEAAPRPRLSVGPAVRLLREERYVRGLASIALLSTLAFTAADFVFKSSVAREVPPGQLGWFFATFYTGLNGLALVTQLVATGWLLRVLGLPRAQQALPMLLLVGFAGVAAGAGVLAAVGLKLVDGSLREAHRTSSELLLVPVRDDVRARMKPFLDVVVRRGGQALASVAILAAIALPHGQAWIAAAGAALCLAWIVHTAALRTPYLDLFRSALREGRLPEPADLPAVDLGSLEALFAALGSSDDREVIAAMDVLADAGRARLIPAFILHHPSEDVALRALGIFERSRRRDVAPAATRLLAHASPRLRAAALEARPAAGPEDREVFRAAIRDSSAAVRAAAVVGLLALGEPTPDTDRAVEELLRSPEHEARPSLARAISHRASPRVEELLMRLALLDDPEVNVEVAHAIGAVRSERFLPVLLGLLAPHEVRPAAREAFLAYGETGLTFLEKALSDPGLRHEIRRHVPRTISRFPPDPAARVLLARLSDEPDGMVRFKILRGLGRIVADHPRVALDRELLRLATERTLEVAFRLLHWRVVLERGAREDPRRATQVHELLGALLRDKERHAVDRLFRLLALRLRRERLEDVHRGLQSPDPKLRASSRELLENVLRRPLRSAVLALVDDAPDLERGARAGGYYRAPALDYPGLLATLLDAPGDTLRTLAVHHATELGMSGLRDRIERLRRERPTPFLERAATRALRVLAEEGRS